MPALEVLSDAGPYQVQLSIGRFPFDFDLYDYAPNGNLWTRRTLGSGSNVMWFELPSDYDKKVALAGHRLVWSVRLIDVDPRVQTTDFTTRLEAPRAGPNTLSEVTFSAQVDPAKPYFFVAVDVKP